MGFAARARAAAGVLGEVLDVIHGRVDDLGAPPAWSEARGWTGFLLSLSDAEVAASEAGEPAALERPDAPPSLAALARAARAVAALPRLGAPPRELGRERRVSRAKRGQLEALLGALAPLADRAARIVEVGAGRGHLTRLAAASLGRDAVGLELDPRRVDVARALAAATPGARFEVRDALSGPLDLDARDLALGLHACGEVGDRLVLEAAATGAALALVPCCPQKIRGELRAPLSRAAAGLALRREALGLANLTARADGVEAPLEASVRGREARLGLRALLQERTGEALAPGAEMRGVNRRRARAGLADLAPRALAARGLAPPTPEELAWASGVARAAFARVRRLSLPRALLARPLEVALTLDRAAALEEAGRAAAVGELFDAASSPRNVLLVSGCV